MDAFGIFSWDMSNVMFTHPILIHLVCGHEKVQKKIIEAEKKK